MKRIKKEEFKKMIEDIEFSILKMIRSTDEDSVEKALIKVYKMVDPLLDKLEKLGVEK